MVVIDIRHCVACALTADRRGSGYGRVDLAARQAAYPALNAASVLRRPSGVLGPVLSPPWSRHLPFASALQRQGVPVRVLASQSCLFLIDYLVI